MTPWNDLATWNGPVRFEGAIGKVVRAKFQIRELEREFEDFVQKRPFDLEPSFTSYDGDRVGFYHYRAKVRNGVPKRKWGVLLGEAVHNLRSALDQAVYAAATEPSGEHEFPVVATPEKWDRVASAKLRSVPAPVVALIKEVQPFHAVDPNLHSLEVLRYLSNQDKHRLLYTTMLALADAQPRFESVRDVAEIRAVEVFHREVEEGAELIRVTVSPNGPNPTIRMGGELSTSIAFSDSSHDGRFVHGRDVGSTLFHLFKTVEDRVIRIEFACKAGP